MRRSRVEHGLRQSLRCMAKGLSSNEFYVTMLKLYTEKGNKEKIALIIDEMRRYKGIRLSAGRFGQDNRDWLTDQENQTISQALSSIKYISKTAAKDLYLTGQKHFDTFTDLLRELQMSTHLDTRQIQVLISLNYFAPFGKTEKLMQVFTHFNESKEKLTKTLCDKSVLKRMEACRAYEASLENKELPISERLRMENEHIGLCLSIEPEADDTVFIIQTIDDKWGIRAGLYSLKRGTSGVMRIRKDLFANRPLQVGDCILLECWKRSPKYTRNKTNRKKTAEDFDDWLVDYRILPKDHQGDTQAEAG